MSYSVELTGAADKFLAKLCRSQPRHAEALENAIDSLAREPRPLGCRQLRGMPGIWRIRVGTYRVCYTVDDGKLVILVITISTRDDVYELVRRYLGR